MQNVNRLLQKKGIMKFNLTGYCIYVRGIASLQDIGMRGGICYCYSLETLGRAQPLQKKTNQGLE